MISFSFAKKVRLLYAFAVLVLLCINLRCEFLKVISRNSDGSISSHKFGRGNALLKGSLFLKGTSIQSAKPEFILEKFGSRILSFQKGSNLSQTIKHTENKAK